MKYSKIQESEFVDIFRIENGTLLYVRKYERDRSYRSYISGKNFNKHTKIIRGCKGLKLIIKDFVIHDYSLGQDRTVPAGTFLLNDYVVLPTTKENFKFEIKTNEVIGGTREKMQAILKEVNDIMETYY